MQESVDQGASIASLILARAGMHAHTGRFVNDSEVVVFVHDLERYVFGKRLERRKLHTPSDDNVLVAVQTQRRFGRDAVHRDLALLDQLLHSDPAYVRELRNQPMVESPASGIGRNAQVLDLAWLRQTALSIQQSALSHQSLSWLEITGANVSFRSREAGRGICCAGLMPKRAAGADPSSYGFGMTHST